MAHATSVTLEEETSTSQLVWSTQQIRRQLGLDSESLPQTNMGLGTVANTHNPITQTDIKDHLKFKKSLGSSVSSRPVWTTERNIVLNK